MQWQYKIRPSGLSNGVARAFSKEALRTMQDAFPIHKAVRTRYAATITTSGLL